MFEVVVKSDVLKEMVKVLNTLLNEVKLSVTPDCITVRAVDPSHVAMIDLELTRDAFVSYEASELELALDLPRFNDFLGIAGHGEDVILSYDEEMNVLFATIGAIKRKLALLNPEEIKAQKMPQLKLDSFVEVGTKSLKKGIRAAKEVGTYLTISLEEDTAEFSSKGDIDSVSFTLDREMCEKLHVSGKVRSMFSLKYFEKLVSAVPDASETITTWVGNDIPVKAQFKIAEGKGTVLFLLAPRIMDNE